MNWSMSLRITVFLVFCVVSFAAFAGEAPQRQHRLPCQCDQIAKDQIDLPVLTRDVATGEVIAESDVTYATVSISRANGSIVRSPADIAGRQARRLLRAGELIRVSDVKLPDRRFQG